MTVGNHCTVKSAFERLRLETAEVLKLCCFVMGENSIFIQRKKFAAIDRICIHWKFHMQRLLVFYIFFSLGTLYKGIPKVFPIGRRKYDPYADKYSLLWNPALSHLILNGWKPNLGINYFYIWCPVHWLYFESAFHFERLLVPAVFPA